MLLSERGTGGVGLATTVSGPGAYPFPHCMFAAFAAGGYVSDNRLDGSVAYGANIAMRLCTHVLQDGAKVVAGAGTEDVNVDVDVECPSPPVEVVVVVGVVPGTGVPNGKA